MSPTLTEAGRFCFYDHCHGNRLIHVLFSFLTKKCTFYLLTPNSFRGLIETCAHNHLQAHVAKNPYNSGVLMNSNALFRQIQVRQCWIGPLSRRVRRVRWVLLVSSDNAIDDGVLALLERDHALRVAITTFVDDKMLLDDVAALQPDVILLNEEGPLHLLDMLSLVMQLPVLAKTRIISYGLEDKEAKVYDYRRVVIVESEDLLELLHS